MERLGERTVRVRTYKSYMCMARDEPIQRLEDVYKYY